MKKAIDVNDLEAQFAKKSLTKSFVVGGSDDEIEIDDDVIEFDDDNEEVEPVVIPVKKHFSTKTSMSTTNAVNLTANKSYAATVNTGTSPSKAMTVEELEAQFRNEATVSPKTSPISQVIGAGPPPGLPPGLSNPSSSVHTSISGSNSILLSHPTAGSASSSSTTLMSSTAPLPKNDPNRELMNRFERNLIMKIHTTQLTTETPLMNDFYYQALTKKKTTMSSDNNSLLYFPLPSAAERQRELQRRERRRRQREKEREKEREKDKEKEAKENKSEAQQPEINAELVLGKVSNSSARKPRQQLQVPSGISSSNTSNNNNNINNGTASLHESVMKGIESVYNSILSVEDYYLIKEEIESRSFNNEQEEQEQSNLTPLVLPDYDELINEASEVFLKELNINTNEKVNSSTNNTFIHFLTIPKGRSCIPRMLKLLHEEGKKKFLKNLVEHFDFLEIVRPETPLSTIDSFILQVLSPLVGYVGEADWESVMDALRTLFSKRSFVWIALTKAGMVLLCILLSRLEILKATGQEEGEVVTSGGAAAVFADEAAGLTEKMFDALEGHLLEFFSVTDPSRDFYAWQCLALLAMNVESDRKRSMILELRDKILVVVEQEDEKSVKNLNVFLNALGLDASQLK